MYKDKHRRHILRYDACKCDAVLRHTADDNEKQVEDNIQNTCDHKIKKRTLCISVCTEHTVTEIEYPECRHPERIYSEIKHSALNKIILCSEQLQHKSCGNEAERHDYAACHKAEHK